MIYALCDKEFLLNNNYNLDDFISAIFKLSKTHNIAMVQYRDKVSNPQMQQKALIYLNDKLNNKITTKHIHNHIPIIINDNLSLLPYCDGIHLGQDDLFKINKNIKLAHKLVYLKTIKQSKLFGLSTHNEVEILQANILKLSYIGLGAYRATSTKDIDNINILGNKAQYLAKISKHKVAIIGGVKLSDNIKNTTYKCICSGLFL
jgi:thiamine-phosphate pyrophosphorylase